jgi:EAL domain-containing protein (putative c-di-GMP-specific phosphodiesterase class I)
MREIDLIARLGGDEFTILIQDVTYKDMILIVKKIIFAMKEVFYVDNIKIYSSFSIGVSSYPNDGSSVEELLKNADIAMYQAKADGKNSFKFYNQKMSDLAHERIALENDIKSALENGEFEAYFQPKVNARTEKIIGLEALIRWNHPKKGLVFPDQFINFAEEIGLIVTIDSFMRRETMRITKVWTEKGLDFGKVSFNASALEFKDKNFVAHIKETVEEMEYDTSKLELEILESQSIENREHIIEILKEVHKLGITISIDDFGTGYSSLSYLKQLPVDKLKIDRSFIMDIPFDNASVALVRTIIALANNLGLEIIAEGVESREQVDFLLQEGCENIQGYYYSKPLPAEEIEELLLHGFKNLG